METEVIAQRKTDEKYMRRAIQLARNGIVGAAPNPMVGAVVVCDGRIIGEGYHRQCGGPHAEVNAVNSVRDKSLLTRSTIYVSLEPCAHYGKTPPCAQLIIDCGIPRVVVGCQDPFAKVDGLGIKMLRDAGVEVTVGVLEQECQDLNRLFFTRHRLHRPYVILKWAQSKDGYMDILRGEGDDRKPVMFSTPLTQALVHKMRAENDAILVGARTAYLDNPSLTTRAWSGRNPLRLVLDLRGSLPSGLKVFDGTTPTRAYASEDVPTLYGDSVDVVELSSDYVVDQIMADLDRQDVQSLIVEGGARTLQMFIDAGVWDEARVEIAPVVLGQGLPVPTLGESVLLGVEYHDGRVIQNFRRKV